MKLIQTVEDINADEGMIFTMTNFMLSALPTTKRRNIDLLNKENLPKVVGEVKLATFEGAETEKIIPHISVIQPKLSLGDAKRYAEEKVKELAKGGFLGVGKVYEKVGNIKLILYPFYEIEAAATIAETEKTGLFSKRKVLKTKCVKINFDAITGEPIQPTEKGLTFPFSFMPYLNREEIQVLRHLPTSFSLYSIVSLGFSAYKAESIIRSLSRKGVIQIFRLGRHTYYKIKMFFPANPTELCSVTSFNQLSGELPKNAIIMPSNIEAGAIVKAVENYWQVNVLSPSIIYYPFYLIQFEKEDKSGRYELFDGIIGSVNETLTRTQSARANYYYKIKSKEHRKFYDGITSNSERTHNTDDFTFSGIYSSNDTRTPDIDEAKL